MALGGGSPDCTGYKCVWVLVRVEESTLQGLLSQSYHASCIMDCERHRQYKPIGGLSIAVIVPGLIDSTRFGREFHLHSRVNWETRDKVNRLRKMPTDPDHRVIADRKLPCLLPCLQGLWIPILSAELSELLSK